MKLIIYARINISTCGILFSQFFLYPLSEWYKLTMFPCPLTSACVELSPQCAAFGCEIFGDDQVTRPPESEIRAFVKEIPDCPLVSLPSEKTAIYEPGVRKSTDTKSSCAWLLDFPASGSMINNFLLFVNHQVYDILQQQIEWTKTVGHM